MLLFETWRRNLCYTMHSRLYIHLQPLQAAESGLAAFDPSTQLFMEVVEVPKPFCIRHSFAWWAEMLLSDGSSSVSRMLGSLENNSSKQVVHLCKCSYYNLSSRFFFGFFRLFTHSTYQFVYPLFHICFSSQGAEADIPVIHINTDLSHTV